MLSQKEVDALVAEELVTEAEPELAAPAIFSTPAAEGLVRDPAGKEMHPYNFLSPERLSKEQMRAVELIHEDLAERLTASLPAYLRTVFRPRLIHIEQGRYDDLAQGIPANTLFNILAFEPLPARAVLIFSPEVAWVILDKMLGGNGRTPPPAARPISDIGQALLRGAVEFMLKDVKEAWSKVSQLEPRLEDATVNSLWVSMLMRNARVALVTFELSLHGVTGTMNLYLPFAMLKPVGAALTPSAWILGQEDTRASEETRDALSRNVSEVTLSLAVELGNADLTLKELTALAPGDVIRLDSPAEKDLRMVVGRELYYLVRPGTSGPRLAVRVTAA